MEFTRPRGTRDFLFDEMRQRNEAENTLKRVFEKQKYLRDFRNSHFRWCDVKEHIFGADADH